MSTALVPCPSCERHVHVTEPACPFCTAALPSSLARRAVPATTQRLSRAATFVFGATLAAAAGCGTPANPDGGGGGDAAADMGGPVPLYGAPADASGPDGAGPDGARADAAGPDGAAADAQESESGRSDARADMGGQVPLYGGPTPVDAGDPSDAGNRRDGGGIMPLYGAPVFDGG